MHHFFLFAGWRAVDSTEATGFYIRPYVGIKCPARANSPASFFVFRVVNVVCAVLRAVAGGRRTARCGADGDRDRHSLRKVLRRYLIFGANLFMRAI